MPKGDYRRPLAEAPDDAKADINWVVIRIRDYTTPGDWLVEVYEPYSGTVIYRSEGLTWAPSGDLALVLTKVLKAEQYG